MLTICSGNKRKRFYTVLTDDFTFYDNTRHCGSVIHFFFNFNRESLFFSRIGIFNKRRKKCPYVFSSR